MTSKMTPEHTCNVPARVLGWEDGGMAKVEILATVKGFQMGQQAVAGPRPAGPGRQAVDFGVLRKQGLRTGGVVLLRKAVPEEDGSIIARSIETLVGRERDGLAMMLHGAAASIMPPPPGTQMVAECMVALASEAVECKDIVEGVEAARSAVARACQFGRSGLIFTGEDSDGDALEVVVGGDAELRPEEVLDLFIALCPHEISRQALRSKKPWRLVPFFRGEVDPDRSSKVSAQRMNLEYGTTDEPMWNRTNAVLRAYVDSWLVCDLSPDVETPGMKTRLLLDILDGA